MTKKKYLIIILVIAACCGGYYVFINLETYEESIDLGISLKTRRNPKLAAEIFLKQSGLDVESRPDFSLLNDLPSTRHSLVITGVRSALSENKYNQLWDWTEGGGTLIVTAQTVYNPKQNNSGDIFLDELGVRRLLVEKEDKETDEESEKKDAVDFDDEYLEDPEKLKEVITKIIYNPSIIECKENAKPENLTEVYFKDKDTPLNINFSSEYYMEDAYEYAAIDIGSSVGTHLLMYAHGNGTIIVLSDDEIWDNQNICNYDHAYLLWLLTKDSDKVWLLYQSEAPSLFGLLVKNNHILLISLSFLILLLLLKNIFRFGSILKSNNHIRRQLREHIDAAGLYYWNNHLRLDLLKGLRKEIKQKMKLRHQVYLKKPEQLKYEKISELSNIPANKVAYALNYSDPFNENEFIRIVNRLQKILESL